MALSLGEAAPAAGNVNLISSPDELYVSDNVVRSGCTSTCPVSGERDRMETAGRPSFRLICRFAEAYGKTVKSSRPPTRHALAQLQL